MSDMETCTVETGLLRKKPCGQPAVVKCANCERPLCGIYFNLHSPYQKKHAHKKADLRSPKSDEG